MYPHHQAKAPRENTFFFIDKNQYILHQIPPLYPSLVSNSRVKKSIPVSYSAGFLTNDVQFDIQRKRISQADSISNYKLRNIYSKDNFTFPLSFTLILISFGKGASHLVYDFGYRLKEAREKRKLTQAQVAARLNLTRSSISSYENNVALPSVEILIQLALIYRVSVDYLLGMNHRKAIYLDGLSPKQQDAVQHITEILIETFTGK